MDGRFGLLERRARATPLGPDDRGWYVKIKPAMVRLAGRLRDIPERPRHSEARPIGEVLTEMQADGSLGALLADKGPLGTSEAYDVAYRHLYGAMR